MKSTSARRPAVRPADYTGARNGRVLYLLQSFLSSGSAAALTEFGAIGAACRPVISVLQDEFIAQVDTFYSGSMSVVCYDPVVAAWLDPAGNIYCTLCLSFIIQPQKGARLFDVV